MMRLELVEVTRLFSRRGIDFAAVDGVSLTVNSGQFWTIVGRSGNGKSTLLHLIAGLLKPTSGQILLDGQNLADLSESALAKLRNQKIGYVTQQVTLLANLTILDNVILPAIIFGKPKHCDTDSKGGDNSAGSVQTSATPNQKELREKLQASGIEDPEVLDKLLAVESTPPDLSNPLVARAMRLLQHLQIENLASSYPKELSGGELRRVALARALINQPRLVLADEPTGDLDKTSTYLVMDLLRRAADQGSTVLMVTHDRDTLIFADKVLEMSSGKII